MSSCNKPDSNGCNCADWESPDKVSVQGSRPEEPLRPYDSPQNTAIEVYSRYRAVETIDSLRCAQTRNICEHPIQDPDLGGARHQCCDHLNGEK